MTDRPLLNHVSRPRFFTLLRLFALLSVSVTAAYGETIDPTVQEQLDTIKKYYQAIQKQLPNSTPDTASEETVLPATPVESFFIPDLTEQAAPINAGANYRAAAYTLAGRDPFAITPVMLENENYSLKREIDFTPLEGNFKIPNMHLKGIITGNKQHKMAALLEIEGLGVFVVREGDTVGLHGIGNGRDVIQIEAISRLSLIVRTGFFGGTTQKRFVVR